MDQFKKDSIYNLSSLVIQVLCGIALNIVIILLAGTEPLGIFNQFYAIFVISGQFFVLGLADTAQKYIASCRVEDKKEVVTSLAYATYLAMGISLIGMVVISFLIQKIIVTKEVRLGIFWLTPAVCLFVYNKVQLGILNGEMQYRRFSIAQATRAFILVLTVLILVFFEKYRFVSIGFLLSEFVVMIGIWDLQLLKRQAPVKFANIKKITYFGIKSMSHGLLTESFIRFDIIILSIFFGSKEIGVYSFIAFIFEGIFQIPYIFRIMTNPLLSKILDKKDTKSMFETVKKPMVYSFVLTTIVCIISLLTFKWFASLISFKEILLGYKLLTILLTGLVLHSILSPIENLLLQSGRPGFQSIFMLLMASINILLNFILIPKLGLIGAAMATSIAFAISGIVQLLMVHVILKPLSWKQNF